MNVLDKTSSEIVEYAEDNGFMELDNPRLLEYAMRKNGFTEQEVSENITVNHYIPKLKDKTAVVLVDQGNNDHAIAIMKGDYLDTYDSGNEKIVRAFVKE